ncbi:MAG: shikimate dehydrogenase [Gammaproteobacteria bacterium]|nr:shikimate dehydrogenase [Gammaproteobacteria bacterium]MDH5693839.1 shikimate dehydrogenase [Gammaproteobacteria bacterium]
MDLYAVMGNPVSHSKSPLIHHLFAQQTSQAMSYTSLQVSIGGFVQAVDKFFAEGGSGLNITVPFKREAWSICAQLSLRAQNAGAVNTLGLTDAGEYWGDNTDGVGLVRDIQDNLGVSLRAKRILILGAGGAVRGVLEPMLMQEPERIVVANRTESKAMELADHFSRLGDVRGIGLADPLLKQPFDIVINGTAASLSGELPEVSTACVVDSFCYDMMYGSKPTTFMRWAMDGGAQAVSDGLGMLVEQAAEAFFLWRKVRPTTANVITTVRSQLL